MGLSADTDCDAASAVAESRFTWSNPERPVPTVADQLGLIYLDSLLVGCGQPAASEEITSTGSILFDGWLERERACLLEQPTSSWSRSVDDLTEDRLFETLPIEDDARLVVLRDEGIPDVYGALAYLRILRLEQLGCGGSTLWAP